MAIKEEPVLIYSILTEAKPIINAALLEKLRAKYQIKKEDTKRFIISTKDIIKKNEELFDLDERTDNKASPSLIYSLILRLRGIFIIHKLLNKDIFSDLVIWSVHLFVRVIPNRVGTLFVFFHNRFLISYKALIRLLG